MDKEDLALLGPALESFLAEFADVAITPTRKLIAAYLRGQLGPLPRKSVMPMAREAGIAPRTLQELLSLHRWDEQLMVDTLQRAGRNLTRAGLLQAAQSLDTTANPFLLPGIRLRTSRTDYFPLDTVYLYRYDNRQWVRASGLLPSR